MKLFLDDKRPCPEGWVHFESAYKMVNFMMVHYVETHEVTEIALDHDLGIPHAPDEREENGMYVLEWLEEMLHTGRLDRVGYLPVMSVHSDNAPARQRMAKLIVKLEQDMYERQKMDKKKTLNEVFTK